MTITIGSSSPIWISLLVSIVGVLLSGFLALKLADRNERIRRHEEKFSTCLRIIFKTKRYSDTIFMLNREYMRSIETSISNHGDKNWWFEFFSTKIYFLAEDRYSSDELSTLAMIDNDELFSKLLKLEKSYMDLSLVLNSINIIKNQKIADPNFSNLGYSSSKLRILFRESIGQIEFFLESISKHASESIDGLGPALKNFYKFEKFIDITPPPDGPKD